MPRGTFEEQSRGYVEKRITRLAGIGIVAASVSLLVLELAFKWDEAWNQPGWPHGLVIAVSVAVGFLSVLGAWYLAVWRFVRIPRETPLWLKLWESTSQVAINREVLGQVFRPRHPPLFVVGKDQLHVDLLQDAETNLRSTFNLKSLKCARGDDLRCLCRLAYAVACRSRPRAGALLPAMQARPLGATGVAVVESRGKHRGRSLICVGGSDTNPLSAEIVQRYSRFWGGFPPLRFTLSTSEVILARTKKSFQAFWESESPEQAMDRTGLVFCCSEPRLLPRRVTNWVLEKLCSAFCAAGNSWTGRSVHVILAGLHREGTKASCEAFEYMAMRSADDLEGTALETTYRYSRRLDLPFAITRLEPDGLERPQVLVQDFAHLEGGFDRENPVSIDLDPPLGLPPDRRLQIVMGRALRDYRDPTEREAHRSFEKHLQLSESCRVIDLIVRYTLSHDVEIRTQDDAVWRDAAGNPTDNPTDDDVKKFFESAKELVLLGTEDQNDYVKKLAGLPTATVGTLSADIDSLRTKIGQETSAQNPAGGFLVSRLPWGSKVVIAMGIGLPATTCGVDGKPGLDLSRPDRTTNQVARATQAAIVGLLVELKDAGDGEGRLGRIGDLTDGSYVYEIPERRCLYPSDEGVRKI